VVASLGCLIAGKVVITVAENTDNKYPICPVCEKLTLYLCEPKRETDEQITADYACFNCENILITITTFKK